MLISSFTLGRLWYPLPRFSSGSGQPNYMYFSVTFLTFVVGQIIQIVLVSNYSISIRVRLSTLCFYVLSLLLGNAAILVHGIFSQIGFLADFFSLSLIFPAETI
jgi:hypothetical protein